MKKSKPSQLMDLFIAIAEELGLATDRDLAELAGVGAENVPNWRSGSVREFKAQTFLAAKNSLVEHLRSLAARDGVMIGDAEGALTSVEVEEGSSPTDLHRQFRDRVNYDYLGHRFLYFEAQGALAWGNLIKVGYEQELWLEGVDDCARLWFETKRDGTGQVTGPIAHALRMDRREATRGLELISLGPGEGGKEALLLSRLLELERDQRQPCRWVSFVPVDVSIPLLLSCAREARQVIANLADPRRRAYYAVLPCCSDFEEGPLSFQARLRSASSWGVDGLRLVLILGNVLGNVRDEETFVRQKLWKLTRRGDLVWIEVGLRPDHIERDPVFRMTESREETASEANRRLLLEGPYRRLVAAMGRPAPDLGMRVWMREDDDSTRIAGSCNFCHDLIIKEEGRACTMLYSRRYALPELTAWLETMDFEVKAVQRTRDSKGQPRVAHLLLRRRAGS